MRERLAQTVLLVRAFEETDPGGRLLPPQRRTEATRRALEAAEPIHSAKGPAVIARTRRAETVQHRARLLLDFLEERYPALPRLLRAMRWRGGIGRSLAVAALAAGVASNVLGPAGKVNLLAFPLLGLLGWNLLVYTWMIAGRGLTRRARRAGTVGGPLIRWTVRSVLLNLPRRLRSRATPGDAEVLGRALAAFGTAWGRIAGPLLAARVRRTLHLAAVAAAAGVVGGMYLRGLAFEYRATWESTLLDAGHVDSLLRALLGPASALLGLAVPGAGPLRAPESGEAAVWIHLYAATTLLFVGLPRLFLAVLENLRVRRRAAGLAVDLEAGYFRRIFAPWSGTGTRLELLPYSFHPGAGEREKLRRLLHEAFGAHAHVEIHRPTVYGASVDAALEEAEAPPEAGSESLFVALFSLAQTPESDVHAAFLRELMGRAAERRARLLVLIDVSRYRARVPQANRWRERLRTWKSAVAAAGVRPVEVDLGTTDGAVEHGDDGGARTLDLIAEALWSGEPG